MTKVDRITTLQSLSQVRHSCGSSNVTPLIDQAEWAIITEMSTSERVQTTSQIAELMFINPVATLQALLHSTDTYVTNLADSTPHMRTRRLVFCKNADKAAEAVALLKPVLNHPNFQLTADRLWPALNGNPIPFKITFTWPGERADYDDPRWDV